MPAEETEIYKYKKVKTFMQIKIPFIKKGQMKNTTYILQTSIKLLQINKSQIL